MIKFIGTCFAGAMAASHAREALSESRDLVGALSDLLLDYESHKSVERITKKKKSRKHPTVSRTLGEVEV